MRPPLRRGQKVGLLPNLKWHSWPAIKRSKCSSASGTTGSPRRPRIVSQSLLLQAVRCSSSAFLLCQRLVQFTLIKVLFLRIERSRVDHSNLFAVSAIHTEHTHAAQGPAQVKEPRLHRKPRRIRQQLDRKRVLERLLNLPRRQRTIPFRGRVVPIKLHFELNCKSNAHAM